MCCPHCCVSVVIQVSSSSSDVTLDQSEIEGGPLASFLGVDSLELGCPDPGQVRSLLLAKDAFRHPLASSTVSTADPSTVSSQPRARTLVPMVQFLLRASNDAVDAARPTQSFTGVFACASPSLSYKPLEPARQPVVVRVSSRPAASPAVADIQIFAASAKAKALKKAGKSAVVLSLRRRR